MITTKSNESKIDWSQKNSVKIQSMMSIYRGKNLEDIPALEAENPLLKLSNIQEQRYDKNEICKYEKHLTVLSNSNFLCDDLKSTLNKSYDMYEFRAFVHQYEKYGMEKSDFIDAFAYCEQICFDYNNCI